LSGGLEDFVRGLDSDSEGLAVSPQLGGYIEL